MWQPEASSHPHTRHGIITGYLFKVIRESLRLTQESLAEALLVDKNTIQGWETGRRSLTSTRVSNLVDVRRKLAAFGAQSRLTDALDNAVEADYLLSHALSAQPGQSNPRNHPLATSVLKRAIAELLSWPFTQQAPTVIDAEPPARRGPVALAPLLTPQEQNQFFAHIRMAAERSWDATEAGHLLLRRQAYYLAAWDQRPDTHAWLAHMQRTHGHEAYRCQQWSPSWVVARSLAVAQARQGDAEALRHFIEVALTSDECEAANLNYWAYWIGEISRIEHTDDFMACDLGPWGGARLLRCFCERIDRREPCVDLYVHSTWKLLQRRHWILDQAPRLGAQLYRRIVQLLDDGDVSAQSHRELDQLAYLLATRLDGTRRPNV
jgi:transcriptional regulator with XRE-family HTH domain